MLHARSALCPLVIAYVLGCAGPRSEPISEDTVAHLEDERQGDSQFLRQALKAPSSQIRVRAALAMGRIQSPSYAPPLAEQLQAEEDLEVRRTLLFALGQLGLAEGAKASPLAVEAVRHALEDGDAELVALAVEALGKLAPPTMPEMVTPFLEHPAGQVRVEAAHALLRSRFVPVWRQQTETPPELSEEATAALATALGDEEADVRWAAAHAFSRYGAAQAADALAAAVVDESAWTRLFAVRALGRSADPEPAERLRHALSDTSAQVRTEALLALAAVDRFDPAPVEMARDESLHVRAALARGLSRSKQAETLEVLHRLEADPSPTVRSAAIVALAQRLGSEYLGALESALREGPWPIRVAAATSLRHFEAETSLFDLALANDDPRVRAAALEAMAELEGTEGRLAEALASRDLAVRGTAVSALSRTEHPQKLAWLTQAYDDSLGEEWVEVRESVVDAVRDDAAAVTLLRRIAEEDPGPSVRSRARLALARRGTARVPAEVPISKPSAFLSRSFAENPRVVLDTSKGEIVIQCLAKEAPIHVASFVERVEQGFYDGLVWHRVVPNFVIQGGDPRGDGWGGPGYTLRDEINRVRYDRGTVGMPKAGKDTGGCQIFITHVPTPHLDGNYTVFGVVASGLEVVDEIEVGDRILRARLLE